MRGAKGPGNTNAFLHLDVNLFLTLLFILALMHCSVDAKGPFESPR